MVAEIQSIPILDVEESAHDLGRVCFLNLESEVLPDLENILRET